MLGLSEGNHYAQVAKETVESALNIRRSSLTEACSQINSLTTDQLNQALASLDAPASCTTPMIDFYKNTLCSDVCINSPLLTNLTSSRRAGGRQLLGGDAPSDPESACEDACFSPFMAGMITVMKTMLLPECKTAFASSRRLLGGSTTDEDAMAALELGFGMLCSENAAGSYCVTLIEGIDNTNENTTGHTRPQYLLFVILIIGLLDRFYERIYLFGEHILAELSELSGLLLGQYGDTLQHSRRRRRLHGKSFVASCSL